MTQDHAIDLHYAFSSPDDAFGISESELRSLLDGERLDIDWEIRRARSGRTVLFGRRVVVIPDNWLVAS